MDLLQYPQVVFRFFGILPSNGVESAAFKYLAIFRMCIFPVSNIISCFLKLMNLVDIWKSAEELFERIGFFNAVLIYLMMMCNKRKILPLIEDLQSLLDECQGNSISGVATGKQDDANNFSGMALDRACLYAPMEAPVQ